MFTVIKVNEEKMQFSRLCTARENNNIKAIVLVPPKLELYTYSGNVTMDFYTQLYKSVYM